MKTKEPTGSLSALPAELLDRMADTLRLLAHPVRLRIIDLLAIRGDAPVHAVTTRLGLPHAATSQHLNQMKRIGLIRAERRGKEVWYSVADPKALTILQCIRNCGKNCGGKP